MRVASFKVALLREINKFEFLMCCLDTCTPDPTLLDTCFDFSVWKRTSVYTSDHFQFDFVRLTAICSLEQSDVNSGDLEVVGEGHGSNTSLENKHIYI